MGRLLYVVNADWYFELHWLDRALNSLKDGFEVYVAFPVCDNSIKENIESLGINVVDFKLSRSSVNPLDAFSSIVRLNRIIKGIKPDLIHSVTIKPNLYCSLLSKIHKTPLASTFAGLGTLRVSETKQHLLLSKVIFNTIKLFSTRTKYLALFENNEDMEFFINNNYSSRENSVRVYGAGVDTTKFSYCEPSIIREEFRVFFASRLLKNKGLEILVRACEKLKSKGINVILDVAGIVDNDSPFSFSKAELEHLLSSDVVNWLGKRDDIAELISNSDLVALPTSYGEGIPRILIEACAIGRPIVTTNLGGCKDICVDQVNGYIVPTNNEKSLLKALETLAENRNLLETMGLSGRNLVMEKFSNDHIFKQQQEIYKELTLSDSRS